MATVTKAELDSIYDFVKSHEGYGASALVWVFAGGSFDLMRLRRFGKVVVTAESMDLILHFKIVLQTAVKRGLIKREKSVLVADDVPFGYFTASANVKKVLVDYAVFCEQQKVFEQNVKKISRDNAFNATRSISDVKALLS